MTQRDFNHFGPWLREKMEQRGVSVEEVARHSKGERSSTRKGYGVTATTLYHWISGFTRPSQNKLVLICEHLTELPLVDAEGVPTNRKEPVRLAEALEQFTPRKVGRPSTH